MKKIVKTERSLFVSIIYLFILSLPVLFGLVYFVSCTSSYFCGVNAVYTPIIMGFVLGVEPKFYPFLKFGLFLNSIILLLFTSIIGALFMYMVLNDMDVIPLLVPFLILGYIAGLIIGKIISKI